MLRRSLNRPDMMTKAVCTAWYRAPELLVHTGGVNTLEVYTSNEGDRLCPYGLGVDIWAFGLVAYELIMGKPMARAATGVGVVVCWVDALGQPCFDAGFTLNPWWGMLLRLASSQLGRRPPLGASSGGEVVKACLTWDPAERASMRSVCQMPWFSEGQSESPASPGQRRDTGEALPVLAPASPPCFDAGEWGGGGVRDPRRSQPSDG